MRYDVMEYFSVYGTALSMWITLMGESRRTGLVVALWHGMWRELMGIT